MLNKNQEKRKGEYIKKNERYDDILLFLHIYSNSKNLFNILIHVSKSRHINLHM